ncbi:MAG TPA: cation diffusion facilitator family transporter [Candidatus Acidoferrales bacterium]|nr:cation diffusion facilitator family transporter [Candidatus Acidoferrales bacterium]
MATVDQRLRHRLRVAFGSLLVDCVMVVAKLLAGLATGSLGLISDAAHSGLDLVASLLVLVAVRTAGKPADNEHPYGHGRAENLAGFGEGTALLVTALAIVAIAANRLLNQPGSVHPAWYAFAVAATTVCVEITRATILSRTAKATSSPALNASAQNRLADVFSSTGVLLGLLGVRLGLGWTDTLAALVVAALILRSALRLLWRSGDILIDRAPQGIDRQIREAIVGTPGVRSVGAVRVRRSGSRLFGDAAIFTGRLLPVEVAQSLGAEIRAQVATVQPDLELTLVIEAAIDPANMVERVEAVAEREGSARHLHNVTVERESDGSLHLSMHAKLPGSMLLRDATQTSSRLESSLRAEFPEVSRIDIHLEPLEPDLIRGDDVTAQRSELVALVRSVIAAHPDVSRCADVELSNRSGHLVAHVVAIMPEDVRLETAHRVETELEDRIRHAVPELFEVVARVSA